MKRPGISVIEVLIAIGIAAIVIAAVGNLIGATHRLTSSSGKELQATAYAKQWLELISSRANQNFGCSCTPTNPCPGATPTCTYAGPPAQTCIPRSSAGFNSCWLPNPKLGSCVTPNMFKWNASTAALDCGNPTTATTDTDFHPDYVAGQGFSFTRTMTVTNLTGNPDTKEVAVTVSWPLGQTTRQIKLSTILTAWENF